MPFAVGDFLARYRLRMGVVFFGLRACHDPPLPTSDWEPSGSYNVKPQRRRRVIAVNAAMVALCAL
jgi:hypothetical protein